MPERKWTGEAIPMNAWGRDHFSMLLYLETRAVDYGGKVDARHMRANGIAHPTYLREGVELVGHSDYDCIADFEAAEILTNDGTGATPLIRLTDKGWKLAHGLRRHCAEGSTKPFKIQEWC